MARSCYKRLAENIESVGWGVIIAIGILSSVALIVGVVVSLVLALV